MIKIIRSDNLILKKTIPLKTLYRLYAKLTVAIGIAFTCLMASSVNAELVHPGGWHTQEDLTLIRTKVAERQEPWISGWNTARNQGPDAGFRTRESALVTSNGAMHTAGFGAWVLTMKWVASGDKSYSDAAINVINHWVENVRDFDVYGPTLILSSGAGAMAQAAEILEHGFNGEAGWNQREADAAKVWFKNVIYDTWTNTGTHRSSNWGTSALGGNMSMAVFMDDEDEYDYQVDAYKFGYQDTHDGCASLTDYITHATGQAFETGRDQAHVQGGIAHLTEAALVMWNQGDDVVYRENNRLLAGVEYHARYNLGFNDLTFNRNIPNACDLTILGDPRISTQDRGDFSPVYYMSAKLFSKAGLDHPNTKSVLTYPGYSPEVNNFAHPGLGMFTFVSTDSDSNGGSQTPNPTPTTTPAPTADLTIPGRIEAENFTSQNGTQVERTGDNGGGDNVGHIEPGDFLSYTANVSRAGTYELQLRVASPHSNANIDVSVNGRSAGNLDVPSTGAWQDYTTVALNIDLSSGNQTIRLDFSGANSGLVNVNWLNTSLINEETGGPETTVVMQKNNTSHAIDGNRNAINEGNSAYLYNTSQNNVNQQWVEASQGSNFYSYKKLNTNLCLDGGESAANGQAVTTEQCDDDNQNQHWSKNTLSNGTVRLEKRGTSHSIDGKSNAENFQQLHLWNSSDSNVNQQWEFLAPR